jgi:hypothetical protein
MVAGGTAAQIPSDLGHEMACDLGEKKEDDDLNPFYTLLTAGTHHGVRNLAGKGGSGALFLDIRVAALVIACRGGTGSSRAGGDARGGGWCS